jgi:Cu(I)/Ag(I) efflux system membrane fusion protein
MVKLYSPDLYTAQQELLQAKPSLVALQKSDIQSLRDSALGTISSARERLRLWGLSVKQIAEIEERGTPEEHVTIYSPSSGLVIHRNAQEGMYVQTGTRIFTIADLSRVWVQLDAYESDLEWLRYGQKVSFEAEAYAGRKFTGRISFIDPVLDRKTRTVKVRVNVENDEGLLKPDMFVRAVVRSRITSGGPVMDASLAGKWLSPMHPEIVKDGPGKCDVCGMDLVPAEELGYVAARNATEDAPLVVPVAATLMTGTRAIVYVELPDTEEPTYEGREVVLGPRAGDEYIVSHGLKEGELVVAEGNFQIDSALQIQAKPSMMNPSGGQSSGGHDHGGSSGKEMEMPAEEMAQSALSEAAQARLQRIERLYAGITAAVAAGDLTEAQGGFSELGAAVKDTDMALFGDKSHEMWMELAMRLSNDAFEGKSSGDTAAAAAALKKLDETVAMMRKQMMRKHLGSRPEAAPPKKLDLSEETSKKLEFVWARYNALHAALAGDDLDAARAVSGELRKATTAIGEAEFAEAGREPWTKLVATVSDATSEIEKTSGIDGARAEFEKISLASEAALRVLGSTTLIHVMHCPMAFDGRGARWLQSSKNLLNPYFGDAMLRCGSTLEVLKPRETTSAK